MTSAMMARMLTGVDRYVMGYVMPKAAELAKEKAGPIGARVVCGQALGGMALGVGKGVICKGVAIRGLALGGMALGEGVIGMALRDTCPPVWWG